MSYQILNEHRSEVVVVVNNLKEINIPSMRSVPNLPSSTHHISLDVIVGDIWMAQNV